MFVIPIQPPFDMMNLMSKIITYYSPRIFETLGLAKTSTKLFATGCYGIAKSVGMLIFTVWLVEKVGRRKSLIYGAFVGSIPMYASISQISPSSRQDNIPFD